MAYMLDDVVQGYQSSTTNLLDPMEQGDFYEYYGSLEAMMATSFVADFPLEQSGVWIGSQSLKVSKT
jgi:hypothetical protein